jgi:hypothetical protein
MNAGKVLGRGVRATRKFSRGEFVLEYAGDYVANKKEYHRRLLNYDLNNIPGSYIFEFKFLEKRRW